MTKEQLNAFLEKAKSDKALQEKLKIAKSNEEVVAIAKTHGHEFTADKLEELREEELEDVAGGIICLLSNINASYGCAISYKFC